MHVIQYLSLGVLNLILYRKQQKFRRRKVSWFDRIYENVEKTFANLFPYQWRDVYQLVGKTSAIHQKSVKTAKVFSCLTFFVYGILQNTVPLTF